MNRVVIRFEYRPGGELSQDVPFECAADEIRRYGVVIASAAINTALGVESNALMTDPRFAPVRQMIESLGLQHTSMSVGDIFVYDGIAVIVDSFRFTNLAFDWAGCPLV